MGDATLAADLIQGVADLMGDLGSSRTLRLVTQGATNPSDPGTVPSVTNEDIALNSFIFDFFQDYMPDANVIDGNLMAIIDVTGLTSTQYDDIKPGQKLVDNSTIYDIIKSRKIETAGVPVTFFLQLKGNIQ